LEMTALFILMRRRLKGLHGMNIWRGFIQAALGTLAMSLVIVFWSQIESSVWISGLGGVALGGLVYAAMMFVLRVPELAAVINGIARRLKRAG
ncbi:MAG: hypothetical protein HYR93_06100, partial [Chloroflexi bacterium]|nr:hypothetical protein [Chloroflexota bacterium]